MATVPTTITETVNKKIVASDWNTYVSGPVGFFTASRPIAYVYQNVAQSIPNANVLTAITMDSETLDRDNQHSTSSLTSRVVIGGTLGWYRVTGTVCYATLATTPATSRRALIQFNGAPLGGYSIIGAGQSLTGVTTTTIVQATASTDYVELYGAQDSAGALNTAVSGTFRSSLLVEWIGS